MKALGPPYSEIVYGSDHAWSAYYPHKFRARRAVMLHAVNLGWSLETCRLVFLDAANPGSVLWTHGEDERLLRLTEVTKRITKDYQACMAKATASPSYRAAGEVRQELSVYAGEVKGCTWRGRSGRTDRDILMYVLDKCIEIGCDRINVSVRDASLGAGVAVKTARESLRRLCKAGWLERSANKSWTKADEFKVLRKVPYDTLPNVKEIHMGRIATPVECDHECWLRLGKAAASIYSYLCTVPYSARHLAALAGVHPSTAARKLPEIASYGLARKLDTGWIAGPMSPDDVVTAMGWVEDNSKAAMRRYQVDVDRDVWAIKHAA